MRVKKVLKSMLGMCRETVIRALPILILCLILYGRLAPSALLLPLPILVQLVLTVGLALTISALYGENTDGIGLVTDLTRNLGVKIEGARLLILGAGGATRGVLAPLLEQEPREVRIANRTPERAKTLRDEFSDLGEISASGFSEVDDRPWDVVVNATA